MTKMIKHFFSWFFSTEKTSDEILVDVSGILKRRSLSARCQINENDIRHLFSQDSEKEVLFP